MNTNIIIIHQIQEKPPKKLVLACSTCKPPLIDALNHHMSGSVRQRVSLPISPKNPLPTLFRVKITLLHALQITISFKTSSA